MRNCFRSILKVVLACGLGLGQSSPGWAAGVTASDCAQVKSIRGLWMSQDGQQVAYLVKAPNIAKNVNEYFFYVRSAGDRTLSPGRLILTGIDASAVQWLDHDRRLALIEREGTSRKLVFIDVATGVVQPAFDAQGSIDSYTLDADGTTIVYGVGDKNEAGSKIAAAPGSTPGEADSGYLVPYKQSFTAADYPLRTIYIRHKLATGSWSDAEPVTIEDPFTHARLTHMGFAQDVSLSPDGKQLLLSYAIDRIPDQWRNTPVIKDWMKRTGHENYTILVRYDVATKATSLAFNSPFPASVAQWARDGHSFLINA
ncbi:MAG TPA: hypothetical protein VGC34_10725, partial [Steroidobacteraceae bacterium]